MHEVASFFVSLDELAFVEDSAVGVGVAELGDGDDVDSVIELAVALEVHDRVRNGRRDSAVGPGTSSDLVLIDDSASEQHFLTRFRTDPR